MIRFWSTQSSEDRLPRLPDHFGPGATLRYLGDAFDIMTAVLIDGEPLREAATRHGYQYVLAEQQNPQLSVERFVHRHDAHRLNLELHSYPTYRRAVLNLSIPGGMTRDALERLRKWRGCLGGTYDWRGHIYGEWRTDGLRDAGQSPVFIEVRQDYFEGAPLVLRVMFHQVMRDEARPS